MSNASLKAKAFVAALSKGAARIVDVLASAEGALHTKLFAGASPLDPPGSPDVALVAFEGVWLGTGVETMFAKKKSAFTGPAVGTAQEFSLPLAARIYKVEVDALAISAGQFVLLIEKALPPVVGDPMVTGGLLGPYANAIGAPGTQSLQRDWSTSNGFEQGFTGGIGLWIVISSTVPLYTPTVTARASCRVWWSDV